MTNETHTEPVDTCVQCDNDAPGRHLRETRRAYLWRLVTEPHFSYVEITVIYAITSAIIEFNPWL